MANVFTVIANQIAKNLKDDLSSKFELKYYNSRVVSWLVKTKAFVIERTETPNEANGYKYVIEIKEVLTGHNSIDMAINKELYHREKRKKAELEKRDKLKAYDIYRQDEECPNWDEEELEKMNMGREKLSLEDNCSFNLFINMIGFDNYEQYQLYRDKYIKTLEDEMELEDRFNEFLMNKEDINEYYI